MPFLSLELIIYFYYAAQSFPYQECNINQCMIPIMKLLRKIPSATKWDKRARAITHAQFKASYKCCCAVNKNRNHLTDHTAHKDQKYGSQNNYMCTTHLPTLAQTSPFHPSSV